MKGIRRALFDLFSSKLAGFSFTPEYWLFLRPTQTVENWISNGRGPFTERCHLFQLTTFQVMLMHAYTQVTARGPQDCYASVHLNLTYPGQQWSTFWLQLLCRMAGDFLENSSASSAETRTPAPTATAA
jgi:hypothetical protein